MLFERWSSHSYRLSKAIYGLVNRIENLKDLAEKASHEKEAAHLRFELGETEFAPFAAKHFGGFDKDANARRIHEGSLAEVKNNVVFAVLAETRNRFFERCSLDTAKELTLEIDNYSFTVFGCCNGHGIYG